MKLRAIFWAPAATATLLLGVLARHPTPRSLVARADAAEERIPAVPTAIAAASPPTRTLTLPGDLVPNSEALVYARATGYVAHWKVDIGDVVHAGEVLAELETPDLDQQLDQARAALAQKRATVEQANANKDYARVTAERSGKLLSEGLVSKQADDQADTQREVADANVDAARADLQAAQASVRQLTQLVSFGHVLAPFDGRITDRLIDIGSLVMAGGTAGAQPLFRIAATDPIRTYVYVPQAYARGITDGQAATVKVREVPGHAFEGRVTRTAGALDPAARTLKVEIDVPNAAGELLGGMYADVTIEVALEHSAVRVPASAVVSDARGNEVATVDSAGVVHLVHVDEGVDDGREIEIVGGLREGQRVLASPGPDVTDGMRTAPAG